MKSIDKCSSVRIRGGLDISKPAKNISYTASCSVLFAWHFLSV